MQQLARDLIGNPGLADVSGRMVHTGRVGTVGEHMAAALDCGISEARGCGESAGDKGEGTESNEVRGGADRERGEASDGTSLGRRGHGEEQREEVETWRNRASADAVRARDGDDGLGTPARQDAEQFLRGLQRTTMGKQSSHMEELSQGGFPSWGPGGGPGVDRLHCPQGQLAGSEGWGSTHLPASRTPGGLVGGTSDSRSLGMTSEMAGLGRLQWPGGSFGPPPVLDPMPLLDAAGTSGILPPGFQLAGGGVRRGVEGEGSLASGSIEAGTATQQEVAVTSAGGGLATMEQIGGVVESEVTRSAMRGVDMVLFYSFGTSANDLSSLSNDYQFTGVQEMGLQPSDRWLRGRHVNRYFKSREHFFQFCKCMYAAVGSHESSALALANSILGKSSRDAKSSTRKVTKRSASDRRASQGAGLAGLDLEAWEADKCSVMVQATRQQALGCERFRRRLLATGTALLAEASVTDGEWGIGMGPEAAARVPVHGRAEAFGNNYHGRALMLVRDELRKVALMTGGLSAMGRAEASQ